MPPHQPGRNSSGCPGCASILVVRGGRVMKPAQRVSHAARRCVRRGRLTGRLSRWAGRPRIRPVRVSCAGLSHVSLRGKGKAPSRGLGRRHSVVPNLRFPPELR